MANPTRRTYYGGGTVDAEAMRLSLEAIAGETGLREAGARKGVRAQSEMPKPSAGRKDPAKGPTGILQDMLIELPARRRLSSIVLAPNILEELTEFLDEYSQASVLRNHSLEPRHTVLLIGPPGNGKTSLAEAIAAEAGVPFYIVRYEGLVDSYLGETATRLRRIMEFAASTPCVLFFDEFDALGKERGDTQETGEIKRVVSSLLVQIDALPSTCLVVCATNHAELLDRAVWRRFELRLFVSRPGDDELRVWLRRFSKTIREDLSPFEPAFLSTMRGQNYSEIEAFGLDLRRKSVLSKDSKGISSRFESALSRWVARLIPAHEVGSGFVDDRSSHSAVDKET